MSWPYTLFSPWPPDGPPRCWLARHYDHEGELRVIWLYGLDGYIRARWIRDHGRWRANVCGRESWVKLSNLRRAMARAARVAAWYEAYDREHPY